MTIIEFIDKFKTEDRDERVLKEMSAFMNEHINAFSDGLIEDFVVIGPSTNKRFLDFYNIDEHELKQFKKVNKALANDYIISNDVLKLCFFASYKNTKNKLFLEFILLSFAAAKFTHYMPHRDSTAYQNRMRYTLEYVAATKSFIKRSGSLFGALQLLLESMMTSKALGNKFENLSDINILDLLGRFRTSINDMLKRLKNAFEKTKDNQDSLRFTQDIVTENGDRLELASNSSFVQNLLFKINGDTEIDFRIVKLLGLTEHEERHMVIQVLKARNVLGNHKGFFELYAEVFLKYYLQNYFVDNETLINDFIQKMNSARMNDKYLTNLDNSLLKFIRGIFDESGINVRTKTLVPYVRKIKQYFLIKIRLYASELL